MGDRFMALLNGQTPEQIASEIVAATEDQAVIISGMAAEELEFLVRYKNMATIQARGEKWYKQEKDNWTKSFLNDMIHSLAKAKKDYLADKEVADQHALFQLLCSRGVNPTEAIKTAYPNGVPAPRKK